MLKKISVLLFLCALLLVSAGHAAAYQIDFRPLTFYLSDDPSILGAGGIDLEKSYSAFSIYHPADLSNRPGFLSCQYSIENVYHPKEGDWAGTAVGSESSDAMALLPFEAPLVHKSAIAVLAKKFAFTADVPSDGSNLAVQAAQNYKEGSVAFSTAPFSFLKAGIGMETDHGRSGPFYEFAIEPLDGVSLGYRKVTRSMHLAVSVMESGHLGEIVLSPIDEEVKEVSIRVSVPDILHLDFSIDSNRHGTGVLEGKVFLTKSIDMNFLMQKYKSEFLDGVTVDGSPSGHVSGNLNYYINNFEINARSSKTRYIAGIRGTSLRLNGAGIVSGGSLLDFWQNIIAGDRYFNYDFSERSTQYYIGMENKTTERLTLRGGLQYITVDLDGFFDHWTPFPLLKIGKLDEQITYLGITKAILGAVTLGLSYRYKNVELTYGFGQIIPVRTEKRPKNAAGGGTGEGGGGGGGGKFHLGDIWDKIKENPGGNIQSVKVTWFF